MAGLKVPIVVAVLAEGGSGGALAIGVGDCHFDAGERLVFGDLARRLRRYLVPRRHQSAGGGRGF